jgi:hypothetical protein
MYAMVVVVKMVCQYYEITQGAVEIGCDGISALREGTDSSDVTSPHMARVDLVSAVRNAILRSPLSLKFRHDKDHQDD